MSAATDTELRRAIETSIREDCVALSRLLCEPYVRLLEGHARMCHRNLTDSLATSAEAYWRARLQVADELVAREGRGGLWPHEFAQGPNGVGGSDYGSPAAGSEPEGTGTPPAAPQEPLQ